MFAMVLSGWGRSLKGKMMLSRKFIVGSLGALVGASMLAVSLSPASAFTLAAPSLEQPVASSQIDKVWWRGGWGGGWHGGWRGGWGSGWRGGWGYRGAGWGWRGGWGYRGPGWGWRGYGWGPAAVAGGLVAGAAIAGPGYYGAYYGPGYPGPGWGWGGGWGWGPSLCGRDYCN
jgi:hypothetical protein